jgi:hypothetical protein
LRAVGQWLEQSAVFDNAFLGGTNRDMSVDFVALYANPLARMSTRDALFSVRFRTATFR